MSEYLRSSGVALCSENGDMHAIFYLIKPRHWIILRQKLFDNEYSLKFKREEFASHADQVN